MYSTCHDYLEKRAALGRGRLGKAHRMPFSRPSILRGLAPLFQGREEKGRKRKQSDILLSRGFFFFFLPLAFFSFLIFEAEVRSRTAVGQPVRPNRL